MSRTATSAPIDKVTYSGLFMATVTLGVWIAKLRGVEVPAEVVTAINSIGGFAIAYLTPLKSSEVR